MSELLLVTGASGFVGHHLVAGCRRIGRQVRALVRRTSRTEGLDGVDLVRGDLATGEGLAKAVAGVDRVIHMAGLVKSLDPDAYFEVNARGTRRLLEVCRAANPRPRRFVYVSSLAAAGPGRYGRPLREDDPPRPVTYYGRSKLEGERIVREEAGDLETTIVRPPAVYGPRDLENAAFLQAARSGWLTRFAGSLEAMSLIEVGDLVEGILLAADAPAAAGRTYFLAHPEIVSLEDMLRAMAEALGIEPRFVTLPGGVVRIAAGISHLFGRITGTNPMLSLRKVPELLARDWTCATERADRELGFRARTPVAVGIPRFVRWYREESGLI